MKKDLLSLNAKSFFWASFFLSKDIYIKCSILYDFCRTLDDIADEFNDLEIKRKNFFKFKESFSNKSSENLIIRNMWNILESEKISKKIVYDLFDGVESDLFNEVKINSKKDLLVYSYRVAGTVGLMMSKILKVNNKASFKGAVNLGIAMQLTNIARDVMEDKKRNRKYIDCNFSVIKETINTAEIFYQKSFYSIKAIPLRSRFSVIVARRIYKKIGDYILKQKNIENYNIAGKIYVPFIGKILETILSVGDFFKLIFIKNINYSYEENHSIINEEINLDERI
ncbi:squalene/phytoene synthase family protein [Pelagibacteraceae bacterium]|nr:squalene/phytoene synthase family protein [Pelagibacteraceae bacterium]